MLKTKLARCLIMIGLLGLAGCSQSSTPTGTADSSTGNSGSSESQKPAVPFFAPKPIVVAAGTSIVVTADQSVSSKTSNAGDHFDASFAAPVMVGDTQAIPKGARATGVVTAAKSAGKFNGHAEISVRLDSVTVNGEKYSLRTSSVTEAGKGRGKRTGIGAGGGAAFGAIVGAIAGGGKGAAIGAGAGAGAGAAGAGFTGDKDIVIGAETKLRFTLKEPVEIQGK